MKQRLLVVFAACNLLGLAGAALPAGEFFELRGRVLQDNGRPFRRALPQVFLQGATHPFSASTQADLSGEFQFKKLAAGMYTLVIIVPRRGEMRRTVQVSPSLADEHGRIRVDLQFEPTFSPMDTHIVSAKQLAIPENAKKEYERAQSRLEKHDVAGAVRHLKKAVEIAPAYSAAWNYLGTIAYQSREYTQACDYFQEALKHEPEAYAPRVNLGGALLALGRVREALEYNREAVRMRPDDALAHSQLGQNYFQLGQLELATQHLKKAKSLDVAHFSFPQLLLAEIYRLKKDEAAMREELREFLHYHPDSDYAPQIRELLGSPAEVSATP